MAKRRSTRRLETIGLLSDLNAPLIVPAPKPRDKRQPRLQFDPMPERIEPCLALLKSKPPSGPDWLFEVKWDGYRLAIHVKRDRLRIITRGGHDWTSYFPSIAAAAKELGPATMFLDGEAVVLDEKGAPNFGLLQRALGGRKATRAAHESVLYAFDLLYFDGLELSSRRHVLGNVLDCETGAIRLSEEIHDDGEALLRHACAHGLEGIIVKDKNAPYRSGVPVINRPFLSRARTWCLLSLRFVAEVNFSAWTHDGHLRHPSFKGIRAVEDHADVLDLSSSLAKKFS